MADSGTSSAPVTSTDQLVELFRSTGKTRDRWRVGTEHEMIGVKLGDELSAPVPYDGDHGISAVLVELQRRGWSPLTEGDHVIGLTREGASISLEPGGQFEHASAPVVDGDAFCGELRSYREELGEASAAHDIAWLSVGFRPFGVVGDVPWVPKGRYAIMRDYLPTRGSLAVEMMKRTATVQVNLDYADEDDAAKKLLCAYSTTSILTAIYANSSVVDGRPTQYQSYRSRIWHDVDPDRCGFLPFIFEGPGEGRGSVFTAYTEWALDVPMFFVYRDGRYIGARGVTFREFVASGFDGHVATVDDWTIHLSTLFPEVRLKGYIEIRGCDVGSHGMIAGLGPLSRGLLYDATAMRAATELTASLSFDQRIALSLDVAREGFAARLPGTTHDVGVIARELLDIAADGLRREYPADLHFLDPLRAIVESRRTQADRVAELFRDSSDTRGLIAALAYPGLHRDA